MPLFKKAIEQEGLGKDIKQLSDSIDSKYKSSIGVAGENIAEGVPNYISTPSEKIIANKNNSWIVLGRDRTGSRLSGYGGKGDTHAASLDLVVGRMGYLSKKVNENNSQMWADPDFNRDAARIYLSQKTDVDKNFKLVGGSMGLSNAKSAIAMKADGIRIIGREGIKLITKTDGKNSQGGDVFSVAGVDLIAGNDDEDLQPIPKGKNLQQALDRISTHLDKLNGIVDAFLMSQMEFNEALTTHTHISPFFAVPTTPSFEVVVPKGIKCLIQQLTKVKKSLVLHKTNLAGFKMTYLNPAGENYINSRFNNTN